MLVTQVFGPLGVLAPYGEIDGENGQENTSLAIVVSLLPVSVS